MEGSARDKISSNENKDQDKSLNDSSSKFKASMFNKAKQRSSQQIPKKQSDHKQQSYLEKRSSLLGRFSACLQRLSKEESLNIPFSSPKPKQESICLIHQKPLDIICLKDQTLICANCAIFGHKGHYFKSLKQFEQDKLLYCKKIVQTLSKRQEFRDKITNKQTRTLIRQKLIAKKEELITSVKKQYTHWLKQLQQSQNSSIEKIDKHIALLEKLTLKKLTIPNQLEQRYKDWHKHADIEMQVFESHNLDEQIKVMNYAKKPKAYNIKDNGEAILEKFQGIYQSGLDLLNIGMDQIKISLGSELSDQIKKLSDAFVQINQSYLEEQVSKVLKDSPKCSNSKDETGTMVVQDLLIQSDKKIPKLAERDQNRSLGPWDISQITNQLSRSRLTSIPNQAIDMTCSSILTMKVQSPTKYRQNKSQSYRLSSKSSIKSPRFIMSNIKSSISRTPRTLSEEKYEQMVEEMIKSHSHTLNLDNAHLGDNRVQKILQKLRCVKIRTAILSRNKLSDQFVEKMWTLMPHVETVNLSNNNLTDKILNNMLTTRRLQKNKNLILFNNKIKEREVKFKIEALNRLGVHIEI